MTNEQLLESLFKLDPENKDHWNQDGQPRLGAIGEGVSRNQVLAVAPLFSRENPVLPDGEAELTDAEVSKIIEDEIIEIELERESTQTALKAANQAKLAAEKAAKDAEDKLEALKARERARDTRSDTEINMDYLRGCFRERMDRAGAQAQAKALLESAGLGAQAKERTMSPIDRSIAQRIRRERKNKR